MFNQMSFISRELMHLLTELFDQMNIIVTNDLYSSLKKKKGDLKFIALRSEPLSSSAVVTNTMHPGP